MRLVILAEDPRITPAGISRYVLPLAATLAERGHEVHYLFSGGYTRQYDWTFLRRWRVSERDGFTMHELRNPTSTGIATSDPTADISSPDIGSIRRRVGQLSPDLIHIHSLVGIPLGVLPDLRELAPVILSVHDYLLLCQRRVLVQRDHSACHTFPTQKDCAWCVDQTNPRRYRAAARLRKVPGVRDARAISAVKAAIGGKGGKGFTHDSQPIPHRSDGLRAQPFLQRLSEGVRLVNESVSSVLAVSNGVRDILLRVGVDDELVQVMHIGSASAERLHRLPLPCRSGGAVTFMFLGRVGPAKGATVLADAVKLMRTPPTVIIAGSGQPGYVRQLHAGAPECVQFRPAFTPDQLPGLLAEADVVVAPAVGPDTGPQIVLEALAAGRPVIGSDVGGIPDFVQDGVNGRIFPCEDASALAAILSELSDPDEVLHLARNARLRTTVDGHVDQLMAAYESQVDRRNGSGPR